MTDEQKAAFVNCAAVRAFARVAGMMAENQARIASNLALAYPEETFLKVLDEEGVHHNDILTLFHSY